MKGPIKFDPEAFKDAFKDWADSQAVSIRSKMIEEFVAARDEVIMRMLTEAGPGHAVGYRLKGQEWRPTMFDPGPKLLETIEWEFHLVHLVDGKLPMGRADLHYVTMKEPK